MPRDLVDQRMNASLAELPVLPAIAEEGRMSDGFGRQITYIRVSVTDRCNIRCVYCMPEEGMPWIPKESFLTFEELATILGVMGEMGLEKVRVTGGEPLLRRGLPEFVKMIHNVPSVKQIALSTNAILFEEQGAALVEAGLNQINISLDTFQKEKFARISRRDYHDKVMQGIAKAEELGINPLKVNCTVLKGYNDDEILDFAHITRERPWHVRFIEFMPLEGSRDLQKNTYISNQEILDRIMEDGKLQPVNPFDNGGPAVYYQYPGAPGTVGFIDPLSHNFCARCNRMRLTAQGGLRPCLFSDIEVPLGGALREGASQQELRDLIHQALGVKPERHYLVEKGADASQLIALSQVGG